MPAVYAQDIFAGYENLFTPPRQYAAFQTIGPVSIDGKLDEASWNKASWSDYFTDIEGSAKPAPALRTRFKLLWDNQKVYIAAELQEPNIWATIKEHDSIVYLDNDFELFIDPDGDAHNYFEIEVNPFNTIFDLFLPAPYRNGGPAIINWDVQHLQSAVSVNGTINNPKDKDKKWLVEMAIPFRSAGIGFGVQAPKDGDIWRANFSRVEWDTEIKHGKYVKKTDTATHRPLPEHNWVWSPQGLVNMHLPERWGYIHFVAQQAGAASIDLPRPASEQLKKYLWLLYYKQQDYRLQHLQFATALSQLNFPASITVAGLNCSISLIATFSQFDAVIQALPGNESWRITQEGKINKLINP